MDNTGESGSLCIASVYQIYKRIATCKSDGTVRPDQNQHSHPSGNTGQGEGEVNISFEPDLSVQSSSAN